MNNQTLTPEEIFKTALNDAYKKAGDNAYFGNGFKAGFDYALTQQENQQGQKELIKKALPDRKEFEKLLEKASFLVPYDGSKEFYDKDTIKYWTACYNALEKQQS